MFISDGPLLANFATIFFFLKLSQESDNDFVSLSSGSNPRRAPRKSWICEHCTYMNNPGVTVCTICCRTTRMTRAEEESSNEKSNDKNSGKSRFQNKNFYFCLIFLKIGKSLN